MEVDTGAMLSIISQGTYHSLWSNDCAPPLRSPHYHLVRLLAVADLLLMVLALQIRGLAATYLGDVALIFKVVTVCVLESAMR